MTMSQLEEYLRMEAADAISVSQKGGTVDGSKYYYYQYPATVKKGNSAVPDIGLELRMSTPQGTVKSLRRFAGDSMRFTVQMALTGRQDVKGLYVELCKGAKASSLGNLLNPVGEAVYECPLDTGYGNTGGDTLEVTALIDLRILDPGNYRLVFRSETDQAVKDTAVPITIWPSATTPVRAIRNLKAPIKETWFDVLRGEGRIDLDRFMRLPLYERLRMASRITRDQAYTLDSGIYGLRFFTDGNSIRSLTIDSDKAVTGLRLAEMLGTRFAVANCAKAAGCNYENQSIEEFVAQLYESAVNLVIGRKIESMKSALANGNLHYILQNGDVHDSEGVLGTIDAFLQGKPLGREGICTIESIFDKASLRVADLIRPILVRAREAYLTATAETMSTALNGIMADMRSGVRIYEGSPKFHLAVFDRVYTLEPIPANFEQIDTQLMGWVPKVYDDSHGGYREPGKEMLRIVDLYGEQRLGVTKQDIKEAVVEGYRRMTNQLALMVV